ncbi:MAG: DUF4340 domain-containing protein [Proteobacteria bacterium]|nr:DUF4340 domain-containing protein [Pseudomonadota bacterium]
MRTGELGIYALFLLICAGLALSSWKGEEPVSKESVVVFDAGGGGLKTVGWEAERNVATLQIDGKGEDASVWITAGRKKRITPDEPATPAPAGDDDDSSGSVEIVEVEPETPAPPQYGEPELTSFPGSSQAVSLVERLSNLTALRQFDELTDEELAGMGLDEPEGSITLSSSSKTLTLEVGSKAYGSSDTYARLSGSRTAYLLSSKDLGSLRSASSSLRDRDLLGFEPADAAAAQIQAPNAAPVPAAHQGRHDKDNSFWSQPDSEERDAVLDGFMKSLLAVKASSYLQAEDMPTAADLEPIVSVQFASESAALGQIELARKVDTERSKDDEVVYQYFARSHRLKGSWAKVSRTTVEEVSDALAGLTGQ